MKTPMARRGACIGVGAGLVLFGLFGLFPGSLLGGAAGINIAGMLSGLPLESTLLSRIIVLAMTLAGVVVSGTVIVMALSTLGWLAGNAITFAVRYDPAAGNERRWS